MTAQSTGDVPTPAADQTPVGGAHVRIAGITPFSTVDWPGKLACVAWLAGCPWRCPYCQNYILQSPHAGELNETSLFELLERRRGLLDGVVLSGGEPLAQAEVVELARQVQAMGFVVGLHSCGAYPERIREILPYLDWVGLDVKAPWDTYERVTLTRESGNQARASLELALEAGISLEVRTTWHPALLAPEDIATIAREISELGVRNWAVQAYRHIGTDGSLPDETVYPKDLPEGLAQLFSSFEFRRA